MSHYIYIHISTYMYILIPKINEYQQKSTYILLCFFRSDKAKVV